MTAIDNYKEGDGSITKENLKKIIPYDDAFLFIDSIVSLTKDTVKARLKISGDEEYLKAHFVGFSIMPGALLVEGLGQAGTLLVRYNISNHESKDVLAYKIKDAQFKKPVLPGYDVNFEVKKLFCDERGAILRGRVLHNEESIAEAVMVLAVVDRKEFRGKYV